MLTRSVLDTKRADEWGGNVLQLVERWLHRDLYLHCGLRSLKRSNADVRARLCRCRGGIVDWKRVNVQRCDMPDAEQRIGEWQRSGDDEYEPARLRSDVHLQQWLLPLVSKSSHMRTDWINLFGYVERCRADVLDRDVLHDALGSSRRHRPVTHCCFEPWIDRDVWLQRWILSVVDHRAGVQADGHLVERRVDRRGTDVQQGAVSRAGAANRWQRSSILCEPRSRLCRIFHL